MRRPDPLTLPHQLRYYFRRNGRKTIASSAQPFDWYAMDLKPPSEYTKELITKLPEAAKPSEKHLTMLLDVAFFASLLKNEGREIRCTLAFVNALTAEHSSWDILRFQEPIRLSPQNLRGLAPAASVIDRIYIGIEVSNDELFVWGLIFHDAMVPTTLSVHSHKITDCILIKIIKPGSLLVKCGGKDIALFTNGEKIDNDFTQESVSVLEMLSRAFRDEKTKDLIEQRREELRIAISHVMKTKDPRQITDAVISFADPRLTFSPSLMAIFTMAIHMTHLEHGGTIIVVPSNYKLTNLSGNYLIRTENANHTAQSFQRDYGLIFEKRRSSPKILIGLEDEKITSEYIKSLRLERKLEMLSHLSAIDGAILITKDAQLLSFGTFLDFSDKDVESVKTLQWSNRKEGSKPLKEHPGGTRHRSAIAWCAKQEQTTAALIASQDGKLTVAIKWVAPDAPGGTEERFYGAVERDQHIVHIHGPIMVGSGLLE